jgi:aminobenzoyl-glutamate transport protein
VGLLVASVSRCCCSGRPALGTVPADGFLRDPETGDLLHSPFMSGIVALIFMSACSRASPTAWRGHVPQRLAGHEGMGKAMETLGLYLVLVFFAAQFVAYFNWTNLGLIVAVKGADVLRASGLGPCR